MSSVVTNSASVKSSDDAIPCTVGRYVLLEALGRGAAGEVFTAEDPQIGRRVAIKLLKVPDGLSAGQKAEWEHRFLLEARAAGRLSHPGIVSIHDVGTASDGRPFIVMELVEGRSLEALRRAASPPPLEKVVAWVAQVADALDAAHRRGVVHRDVKPANILIDAEGGARIADFGIARLSESEMTRDGAFLGSPAFAAPEQIRGARVDGRADLFSLGAVLYTLTTGRRPFEADDIGALAYAVCHTEPIPPSRIEPRIGSALEAAILRALAKEPIARFSDGAQMARALRAAMEEGRGEIAIERTVVEAASARTAVERRAVAAEESAAKGDPASTVAIEHRAAAVGSKVAVFVVRGTLACARVAADTARRVGAWIRLMAPVVGLQIMLAAARAREAMTSIRGGAASTAAQARGRAEGRRFAKSRAVVIAGVVVVAAVAVFLTVRALTPKEAPESGSGLVDRLMAIGGRNSGRVAVVVEHGLEDGILEIWVDGNSALHKQLHASRHDLLGVSFLSYRKGREEWGMRLPAGTRELWVSVTATGKEKLAKKIEVNVEPKSAYRLGISVGSWPRSRLALDWESVAE